MFSFKTKKYLNKNVGKVVFMQKKKKKRHDNDTKVKNKSNHHILLYAENLLKRWT